MSQSATTRLSNVPKAAELIYTNSFQLTSIDAIIATTQGTKGFFYHLKKKKEIGLASLINEVICPGIRADSFFTIITRIIIVLTVVLLVNSVLITVPTKLEAFSSSQKYQGKGKPMNENGTDPTIIDIWSWQREHAFVQGRVVDATGKIIFCAGQTSVDENGNPIYQGDMAAQIKKALDNLEAVLAKGGAKLKDVVRMTYYVRDMPAFLESNPILLKRYTEAGCNPTSTLIGVASLFHPDILFEVEATAVIE